MSSDCLNVVEEINAAPARGQHCMILKEITARKEMFQDEEYIHEWREANGEAHCSARTATSLDLRSW